MQSPSASTASFNHATSSLSTAANHNGSKTGDELDAPMSGDANTGAADPYKRCTLKRRQHLSRPARLPLIVPSVSSESATSGSPSNDGTGGGGLEPSGRVCSRKRPVPLKPKPCLSAIAAAKGGKHSAEPVVSRLCNSTTTSSTCKLSTNITTTSATISSSVSRLSATVPSTTNRKSVADSEPVSVTVAEAATAGGGRGEGLVRKLTIRYDGAPGSDSCVPAIAGSTGRGHSSSVGQSARWSRSVRSAAAAAAADDNDGDSSASVSLVAAAAAKRDGQNSGTSSVARCTSASTSTFYTSISTSTTTTNTTSTSTAAAAAVSSNCGNDTNNNVTGGAVETQSGRVPASLSITELKQMIRHLPLPGGAPPAKPPRTFTHSTDTINNNNSGGGSVADSEGSSGGGVKRGKLNNFVSSLARHVNRSGLAQKATAVNTDGDGDSAAAAVPAAAAAAAAKCPVGRKVGKHAGHTQVGSGTADHGRITSLPDGDQLDAEVLSRAKDARLCRSVMLQRRAASKGVSNRPAVRHSACRAGFGFSDLLGFCVKPPAGYASLINLTDSAIEHIYDEPCTDCGSCGAGKWSHMCSKRSAVDRQRDYDATDVAVPAAAAPEKVVQPYAVSALIGADLTPGTPHTNEAAHCTPSQAPFCGRSFGQSGRSLEDCGRSEAMNRQENPVGLGGGRSKHNDSVNRSRLSACITADEPEKSATLLRRNRAFIRRQRPLRRDGDSSHELVTASTPATASTSTTAPPAVAPSPPPAAPPPAAPSPPPPAAVAPSPPAAAAPPPPAAAAASAAKKSDASNGSSSNTASAAVAPPPRPPQPVAAARRRLKTAAAAGARSSSGTPAAAAGEEALWTPSQSTLQRSRHVDLVQSKMLLRRPSADTAQGGGVVSALAIVTAPAAAAAPVAAAPTTAAAAPAAAASDQAGSPRVVSCHPSTAEIPDMFAQLCFPYHHHCQTAQSQRPTASAAAAAGGGAGRQQQQQEEEEVEEPACYCVTLVDRHNTLVYAVCRPVVQAEGDLPPLLYCLLARRPLPSLLANVLSVMIELPASSSAGSLDQIMSQLTSQPPPPLGHKLLLTLPKPSATLSSGTTSKSAKSRPTAASSSTLSTSSALSSTACSPNDRQIELAECVVVRARDWTTTAACANIVWLARRVGVNVFVRLFASTLLERTIILSSRHHSYLHRGVSALLAAICPFVWQHCVVPVLPSSLAARVLDSSPCLVGVAVDCRFITDSLGTHHCMCVDLDEGGVLSAVGDESTILPASVQSALGRLLTQQCDTADDAIFSHRRGHHSPRSHFQQALAATLAPLFGDNFSRFCHKSLSEIRSMLESDCLPDDVHQFLYWFCATCHFRWLADTLGASVSGSCESPFTPSRDTR